MLLSWLAAGAGLLVGIQATFASSPVRTAEDAASKVIAVLFIAYLGWALFWGSPPCWRWLWRRRSIFSGARRVQTIGWALHLALVFTWMIYGVLVGSIFGAGVYQFLRHRRVRLASNP